MNNASVFFSLQDPRISTLAAKPLALPLVDATRSTAYYYSFQLTVNTRNAYDGQDNVARNANLSEAVFIVTTRLQRVAANNTSDLSLHPLLTTEVLRSPNNTLQNLQDITESPPVLDILKKQGQSMTTTLRTHDSRNTFTTFHDEGALNMANASKPTTRTRHMDIRHFAIQEWVECDLIRL
jgi:hypothetical protein